MTQRKDDVKNFWAESEDAVVGSGMREPTAEWYVGNHCANVRERMCGGFLDLREQLAENKDRGPWGHDMLRASPLTSFMISSLSRVVKRLSLYTILPLIITSLTSPPVAEYTSWE